MESRIINIDTRSAARSSRPVGEPAPAGNCPHCEFNLVTELERAGDAFNSCYRCIRCGHVFSPRCN